MTRIKGRFKLLLALVAGVALVAVTSTAVAALVTGQFGYKPIRSGTPAAASQFKVASPDFRNNQSFAMAQIAGGFGCTGGNVAPRLAWSGQPTGTQSFAITMYDPDAPTGSGFWHWLAWDIPKTAQAFDPATPPAGMVSGTNDASTTGYFGPCPPAGDRTHRYQVTVFALDVANLGVDPSSRAAVVGFVMRDHILGFAQMIGTFQRT